MRRGDVVIGRERGAYTQKPRPWLVVQHSAFLEEPASVTVCAISTTTRAATFRVPVGPDENNGLNDASLILADKVMTLKADAIDRVVGAVDGATMTRVEDAMRLWLDL